MRTVVCEKYKCFQFATHFLRLDSFKGSKTIRLQLRWLFFDDNQFENSTEKAPRFTGPVESSRCLYPCTNKSCYNWLE